MHNSRSSLKHCVNSQVLLLTLMPAFLAALIMYLLQPRRITAQDQRVQVVELKAKKYEYLPSPVHVKAVTKVQLKINGGSTKTDTCRAFARQIQLWLFLPF